MSAKPFDETYWRERGRRYAADPRMGWTGATVEVMVAFHRSLHPFLALGFTQQQAQRLLRGFKTPDDVARCPDSEIGRRVKLTPTWLTLAKVRERIPYVPFTDY